MSERSQRKRAVEDYLLRYPPLPRVVRLVASDMIKCVECRRMAVCAVSEDSWRVFPHEDGEWDDHCPECAERRLSNSSS
jgi:hypothetical protein